MAKHYARTVPVKEPQLPIQPIGNVTETGRNRLKNMIENISGDKFCYINFYYPGGRDHFPENEKLWRVDRYYPNAVGGPLFVDEPRFEYEIQNCKLKSGVMKEMGHRYIICLPQSTEIQLMEQIA